MPDLRSLCKRFIALPLLIGISSLGAALPASAQQCYDDCDWNRWMCVEDCRQWAGPSSPWNPNNYCYDDCDDNYNACMFACDNPPSDETVIKDRLSYMVAPVLGQLQDPQFRNLVYAGVARRFDGDDNVLLSTVINEAEQAQIVDPNSWAWQSLKAQVASFQDVNGTAYDPQIYIPNYQDGALPTPDVTLVVMETNLSLLSVPAYQVIGGGTHYVGQVDEAYSESYEVFVLSVNEDLLPAAAVGLVQNRGSESSMRGAASRSDTKVLSANHTGSGSGCTGNRNNGGREFLVSYRVPNPSQFEHWTAGQLEPQLAIFGKGGAEIANIPFGKIKRKAIRNGITVDFFITTWERALWGDYWIYKWIEVDKGPSVEGTAGLSGNLLGLIQASAGVKVTWPVDNDDMGAKPVVFTELMETQYATAPGNAGVHWRVCNFYP